MKDHLSSVTARLGSVAGHFPIKCAAIVGGMSVQKQDRLVANRPEIVVGTPGRLWSMMSDATNYLSDLTGLKFVVLDEADRMVEKGHFKELDSILHTLKLLRLGDGSGAKGGGLVTDEAVLKKTLSRTKEGTSQFKFQTFL